MITFSRIFGQASAVDALVRAYSTGRLPHGLLFAGPIGVGKATTAAALAALFLCENAPAPGTPLSPSPGNPGEGWGEGLLAPCGRCESCRAFEAGAHPDYRIITRKLIRYHDKSGTSKGTDLAIDVIRNELVAPAGLKPVLGHGKVFIIEEAETMNISAQNAMLKTLEEPAGRTLIILLTDQPDALLPTIRSRCRMVRFSSLDVELVARELQKHGIGPKDAEDAARLSGGSLGLAMQWLDEGVIEHARDLAEHLDGLLAGRPATGLETWFKEAADAYANMQLKEDELASKDQAVRQGLVIYLLLAAAHLRGALQQTRDADRLERICAGIDAIARAERYIWSNVNTSLILQQLTLAWEEQLSSATAHLLEN